MSKSPNTDRWGGPGASHENAKKPHAPEPKSPAPGAPTNTSKSQVSGGGGERDRHHSRDPERKGTTHKHEE